MESLPSLEEKEDLHAAAGSPPAALDRPAGCVFHPRCQYVMERCLTTEPGYYWANSRQRAACFLLDASVQAGKIKMSTSEEAARS
jgi:oligopeptide/dipeptide ABC transporter ATP-binding protein